jgi:hypothetical protein
MPKYYIRKQKIADSTRAFEWFKMTKDSSYIKKFVFENLLYLGSKKDNNNKKQNNKEEIAIWNDTRTHRQKQLART